MGYEANNQIIKPDYSPQRMELWTQYFLYYSNLFKNDTKPSLNFSQISKIQK